ncbi:hypothetical protein ACJZ2D_003497 [Fusarium nematophilum]
MINPGHYIIATQHHPISSIQADNATTPLGSKAMEPLPSHRQLLTTLITSISNVAPSPEGSIESPPSQLPPLAQPSTTPLQSISPSQRPLLLTLHVLFPNLLLPALDLLDRGLVARLRRTPSASTSGRGLGESEAGGGAGLGASQDETKTQDDVFLVRSLATTLSRRSRDFALSSQRYIIHLNAWNCSCASFTLDAFPSHTVPMSEQTENPASRAGEWSFGGMGAEPRGDAPPCCKHLLACLLVDKWPGMLGRYVEERVVSRDEMAGIVADI